MEIQSKKLYNFILKGGEVFDIQPEGNPYVSHNGIFSDGQLLLTKQDWNDFCGLVKVKGVELEHNEFMTREERKEEIQRRKNLSQMDTSVFLTMACSACTFCDLRESEGTMVCGLKDWMPEMVEELLKQNKPQEDKANCPLGKS